MEKEKINITVVQIGSTIGDIKKNKSKISDILTQVKTSDLIILPEVWTVGWSCDNFINSAEEINDSETLKFLSRIAKEKNANIIGGSFITKKGDKFYNTCPVINRKGELVATYDKMHLYTYYGCNEGKYITEGKEPTLVDIEGVKIGLTICYDIRFPEIYREYRKTGADILVNVAAWSISKPDPWEIMTRSRAIENQTYMIAANQYGIIKEDYNLGHSRIIDYNGNILSEILNGEGILNTDINLNDMYNFRGKCTILNDIKETYEVKKL